MGPHLPEPRGPLSQAVARTLLGANGAASVTESMVRRSDPYGDDLQLALYQCYELHYRGFSAARPAMEWDPELLKLRGLLEERFLSALRKDATRHADPADAMAALLVEPLDGPGPSHHLGREGELWQLREYAALRSLYHLKEADPHAWVIPRLRGRSKAAMVAVEFDEFGGGHPDRIHARLWAELMADLDLDDTYGHYVDAAPAEALLVVTMMSLFGLHRSLRGALVGHFATVEVTSSPASRRMVSAMRRLGAGPAAVRFYAEHVEADAVHEQVVRRDVIGGLLDDEPDLARDVAFGIDATVWAEDRLGDRLVTAWRSGRSCLRTPL
jgi:Iron-containing redox enzyme